MKNLALYLLLYFFASCSKDLIKVNSKNIPIIDSNNKIQFVKFKTEKDSIKSILSVINFEKCNVLVGGFKKVNDDYFVDNRIYIQKQTNDSLCNFDNILIFYKNKLKSFEINNKSLIIDKKIKIGDNVKIVYKIFGNNYSYNLYPIPNNSKKNLNFNDFGNKMITYDSLGYSFVLDKKGKKIIRIILFDRNL